jgi:dipeptidase
MAKKQGMYIFLGLLVLIFIIPEVQACTTMIITKGASATGSTMIAHSDDDELGDQRMVFIPSVEQTGFRKVYAHVNAYPRIVSPDRGPGYDMMKEYPETKILYELPYKDIFRILGHEVPQSYAYFDAGYGIMNEYNLMFGECTDGANYEPNPNSDVKPGHPLRIFYSAELSRIALENCKTAREAIKLMGGLIDKYGLYETGETLLVGDENESWVFEMCALPDDKYHSAWVAQRVPDGEFFVAANEFRIRYLVKDDPDNFLYSSLLIPGLKKIGWWDEAKDGPVDWLKAVSPGEYNHPYYSLRRVWRVFDRVNPNLAFSPWVEDGYTFYYPFSIKPLHKLTREYIYKLYRDHYEGTEFDLTKGVAAGPYGDPHRFVGPYDGNQNDVSDKSNMVGAWERSISVFYQGYTWICEIRPDKPDLTKGILWFGPDVSYTTCFIPVYTKVHEIAETFQVGEPQKLNFNMAWWAFNFVNNWSRLNFQLITKADIIPLQQKLEKESALLIEETDAKVANFSEDEGKKQITEICKNRANKIVHEWWHLAALVVGKYSDGYVNLTPEEQYATPSVEIPRTVGYPSWFLSKTNYGKGPTTYTMP